MSAPETKAPDLQAAYRIIVTLVDSLTASSDLIAVMARLMGENAVRPLQSEPAWQAYLEAKRRLEKIHEDMHRFAEAAISQSTPLAAPSESGTIDENDADRTD